MPHAEIFSAKSGEWKIVPGTLHKTGDAKSVGAFCTTVVLSECRKKGIPVKETGDGLGKEPCNKPDGE